MLSAVTAFFVLGLHASNPRIVIAQSPTPVVFVVPIEGMIDLGLAPFLARTINEAKEAGAAAVLLDINTFGGRVDAAVAMRDALLNSPVRTIAFVNQRAISAGALIALACETLVMTEGGTIGVAAPVVGGAGESKPAGRYCGDRRHSRRCRIGRRLHRGGSRYQRYPRRRQPHRCPAGVAAQRGYT